MKGNINIQINSIEEVVPTIDSSQVRINIGVSMEKYQMENLVYSLWEYLEDDAFIKLIEAQGYKVKEYQTNKSTV